MDDLISRQAAIDAIGEKADEIYKTKQKGATYPHNDFFQGMAYAEDVVKQLPSAQPEQIVRDIATIIENEKDMRVILKNAQPEPAIPLSWIKNYIEWLKSVNNMFSTLTAMQISTMVKKWKDEQNE